MQPIQRVFITGSNRGLGQQLIKLLYTQHPQLKSPEQLAILWKKDIPKHEFKCYQMDINQRNTIQHAYQNLKKSDTQFQFIVANAAIRMPTDHGESIPSEQAAQATLQTNLVSTIDFIKKFVPLLTENGRLIVVSSDFGALSFHSQNFQNRIINPSISQQQILQISNEYIAAAKQQKMGDLNWSPYKVSKVLLNSWSRFILPKHLKANQTFICMHPGWCRTDMGGPNAYFTPQYGGKLIYQCFWLKQIQPDRFYNQKFCSYVECQ